MDELSAAVGVAQLERIEQLRSARAQVAAAYEAALHGHDLIHLPSAGPDEDVDWFVYVVRLDPLIDRSQTIADLAAVGIPSRPYFQPLHLQPFYRDLLGHVEGDFPVTERVAASTLALPWSSRLRGDQVERVATALSASVERQAGR
jgi:perosamine synthetase